ncbi:MAG: hypothetical protein VX527_02770 [Planctomycetota bacterium]|nr:hypothetical protein [Planctomycetota bacterium]
MKMSVMIGFATGIGLAAMGLAETHDIAVGSTYYEPQFVFVQPGDTINWFWEEGTHDVTSGESCGNDDSLFASGDISIDFPNFQWTVSSLAPNVMEYFCSRGGHCVNGNQFGALIQGNGVIHEISTDGFSFSPPVLTGVNVGDTVIWVHGGGTHSVTFGEDCVAEDGGLNEELSNLNPMVFWQVPESAAGSTQNYFCTPHCGFLMTASIEINEGGGNDCPSDVNGDGTTNVDDLLQLLGEFGTDCTVEECTCDVDGSGAVDVNDLLSMLGFYGEDC